MKAGRQGIIKASEEGDLEMVQALLAAGADKEATDNNGALWRPLVKLIKRDKWDRGRDESLVMLMLLDMCVVSQIGSTALIWASSKGHLEVVKALLAAGTDTEAKDEVGVVREHLKHYQWVMMCKRDVL